MYNNGHMRILIIEDDKAIRNSLVSTLRDEAYAVDAAEDGEKGSYAARVNDYDLIILDLVLPKKEGADVCKEIRASGKKIPILILTTKSQAESKVQLLDLGADDYLTKPFSFRELIARVRALLRRPPEVEPVILQIDDLRLDTYRQQVERGDREIYLTRKEFTLLEYLMKNKGVVLSRGMIMEHVWDAETDPFSNTIEAHILNVRKKIDGPKKKKLIETVPGRGYRMSITRSPVR
jgi:two-component system copper resistance phosphate regulon response regulator CusR